MIAGKDAWDKETVIGLSERCLNGRFLDFYAGVPDNLFLALQNTVKRFPNKIFITDDSGREFTFLCLYRDTCRLAGWLSSVKRIKRGDQVGIMLYNSYEFCVIFLALIRLEAAAVFFSTKLREPEVDSLLQSTPLSLMVCDESFGEWFGYERGFEAVVFPEDRTGYGFDFLPHFFEELLPLLSEDSAGLAAAVMFTSGTTSKSKAAVIRNYNIMHAVEVYRRTLHITEADRTVVSIPLFYVTGLIAVFGLFLTVGGAMHIHRFFDANRVLKTIKDEKLTFLHASPTVFSMLLAQRHNFPTLPSLTAFACGSSNMSPETLLKIHNWLPSICFHTIYGLTETSSPVTVFPGNAALSRYIGSSGKPIPGVNIKIIAETGKELSFDEIGQILVSGTVVIENYYKLENKLLETGWLDTGDIGYLNSDGYLYVVDRKKDMINRGGEKVCSYDVENELLKIEGVVQTAVVGIPDEIYGEVPVAAIHLEEGYTLTEQQIRDTLCLRLAKYKVPVKILFVHELPLTQNFKVDKHAVRQLFNKN